MESRTLKVTCECAGSKSLAEHMAGIVEATERLKQLVDAPPTDFLGRSFFHTKSCTPCEGRGWHLVANGQDDFDKEPCTNCNGTGRVIANN